MTFIKTCWTFMSKLFVLPQMIYWLKKLVCMEEQKYRPVLGGIKSLLRSKKFSLTLIPTFERMMNKLFRVTHHRKSFQYKFCFTIIVVAAINAWLEAYGLALTLIATNKVSQRSASSTQLIIREVKVIHLFVLICLRFLTDNEIIFHQT